MPSLSAKDRVSLCQFTFADGRRCRTPRTGNHPYFCFDHAQQEARAHAAESLGKDLTYFFSGDYLSACDLSTALGRLLPAVLRGDVKPRTARTVAYLAQTLLQTIHLAKHEYINTFGTDGWRNSIRNSVNGNYNHRFPPAPEPEQPESPQPQPQSAPPSPPPQPAPAQQPAPSPHTSMPPTAAEFAQQLLAGLPRSERPGPTGETGGSKTPQPTLSPTPAPQSPPSPHTTANTPSAPATQSAPPPVPTPPPASPEQGQTVKPTPPRQSNEPNRDAPWWDSRHLYDPPDSHLL